MVTSSKMYHLLILCTTLFVTTSFCDTKRTRSTLPRSRKNVALFIFGDSLYDPGNNNHIKTIPQFQANYPPYGKSFFKKPTGRFCDGRLIPDFIEVHLEAEYAKMPLIPAYMQADKSLLTYGVNFASAGAGALDETYGQMAMDLKAQLNNFKNVQKKLGSKLGAEQAKQMMGNAVYMFSIASNDYAYAFITNATYSRDEFVQKVVGNITLVIKEIYRQGGRKFGILGLPPFGCFPSAKAAVGGSCFEEATVLIKLHNRALLNALQKLARDLDGFKYSYTDFYSSLEDRMNNPSLYGFKVGKSACCGTGLFNGVSSCGGKEIIKEYQVCKNSKDYVFFDAEHPSQRTNRQVAKLMWSGSLKFTMPCNLRTLFDM